MYARSLTKLSLSISCMLASQAAALRVEWNRLEGPFADPLSVSSAADMSPDGRFIVGGLYNSDTFERSGYIWDRQTDTWTQLPTALPQHLIDDGLDMSFPVAVSDDGQIILADTEGSGSVGIILDVSEGVWQSVGHHPSALNCPSRSAPYDLNSDGSVAVGLTWVGCSARGFSYTDAAGLETLGLLNQGGNRASVIAGNGSIIGGFAQASTRTPAVWGPGGSGQLLDPIMQRLGEVRGVRDDGSVLLGTFMGDAVMWTDPTIAGWTVTPLDADGSVIGAYNGNAMDIADDGTIVGFDSFQTTTLAWIQYEGLGDLYPLKLFVLDNGGIIPSGTNLGVALRISTDSSIIIGSTFGQGPWYVTIEPEGSCCLQGACADAMTAVECTDAGGIYNGDETFCSEEVCPDFGACCDGSTCSNRYVSQCGGTFQGAGTDCTTTECSDPTGACCAESSCTDGLTEAECLATAYVCDQVALGGAGCLGDSDLSGVVNASDRGFVSANIGISAADVGDLFATLTDFYNALCVTDLDCSGVVNASDRGFVSANIGLCVDLPPCQNGAGLNASGDGPDPRFANSAVFQGAGTDCGSASCP